MNAPFRLPNVPPRRVPRPWWRIICATGAAVALVALQGCSAIKLGHNQSPEIAYWWLDGYVDFEGDQTRKVREDLAGLQQWHRTTELPQIDTLLAQTEKLALQNVVPAQTCQIAEGIRTRLTALAQQAEGPLTVAALDLEPQQIANIRKKFERNNADYRKEWLEATLPEQRALRFKQVLERSETMYGRLDGAQRDAIRQQIERSSFDAQRSHAETLRRQQDVLQTLEKMHAGNPSLAEARASIHGVMERAFNTPDAALRKYQETLLREGCDSAATVHNSTSVAQRETALKRLQGYRRDVKILMTQEP